jgi:hypothetical protein
VLGLSEAQIIAIGLALVGGVSWLLARRSPAAATA